MSDSGDLRRFSNLIDPITASEFFDRYCDREQFVVNRDEPSRYGDILSLETVEEFIFERNPRAEHLQVLTDGKLDQSEYLYPSGLADSIAVGQLFENGGSLVLPHAHTHPPRARLPGAWAGGGAGLPGAGQRLPVAAGRVVVPSPLRHPRRLRRPGPRLETMGSVRGTRFVAADQAVQPGDRHPGEERGGQLHHFAQATCATCPGGSCTTRPRTGSLHVTIGVHWVRVSNLVLDIVQRAIEHQPELQRIVPHGWWREGESRAVAVERALDVLPSLADEELIERALRHLRDDLVSTRQPLIPVSSRSSRRPTRSDRPPWSLPAAR